MYLAQEDGAGVRTELQPLCLAPERSGGCSTGALPASLLSGLLGLVAARRRRRV
jgi:hypothetical protein